MLLAMEQRSDGELTETFTIQDEVEMGRIPVTQIKVCTFNFIFFFYLLFEQLCMIHSPKKNKPSFILYWDCLVHPLSEARHFNTLPLSQLSSDWLPLTNRRFEQQVGGAVVHKARTLSLLFDIIQKPKQAIEIFCTYANFII